MKEFSDKYFCIVPFVQLNTRGQGNSRVCCSIGGLPHGIPRKGTVDDVNAGLAGGVGTTFDLRKDSVNEMWNSQFMRDFRLKMIQGEKISNCEFCYRLEARGVNSKRVNRNRRFLESHQSLIQEAEAQQGRISSPPIWYELRFSTKCNLSCRMCTPGLSTRMLTEYKAHRELLTDEMKLEVAQAQDLLKGGHLGESQFFRDQIVDFMEQAEFLEMRGGEVLVDPEAVEFLRDLSLVKKWGRRIHFDLSSNIQTLDQRHIEIFNGFKSGTIKCSIDGFAEENEYIRHPSKWGDTLEALKKLSGLHKGWNKVLQATISAYQVCTIYRLLEFLDKFVQETGIEFIFSFTMVRDTPHLDPEIIPLSMRQEAAKRVAQFLDESYLCQRSPNRKINSSMVKALCEGMMVSSALVQPHQLADFVTHTKALDQIRGQRYEEVFPHLAKIFPNDLEVSVRPS